MNPVSYESGAIAENIVAGKGFSFQNWQAPGIEPTAQIPPLYPFFLAVCFKFFGPYKFLVAQLVQGFVLAGLVYPIYGLTRSLYNDHAAWVTATLSCFYPPFIYYTKVITYDPFMLFGLAWGLYFLVRLSQKPTVSTAGAAAGCLGLGSLASPILLPFTLLALGWLFWVLRGHPRRKTLVLLFSACFLMTISPWMIRNAMTFKRFIPIRTGFGYNLWLGNRPGFPGIVDPTRRYEGIQFQRITNEERERLKAMDDATRDQYLLRQALGYIRDDPKAFFKRSLYRIYAFWWMTDRFPRGEPLQKGLFQKTTSMVQVRKVNLVLLYLLGAFGFWVSRQHFKIHTLFFILFFTLTAVYGITQSSLSRNQLPGELPILLYSGIALSVMGGSVKAAFKTPHHKSHHD